MAVLKLLVLFSALGALTYTAPIADQVNNLPGLNFKPNFIHYSGYLNAAPTRKLHYWFVQHQFSSSSSPVLLWLNGGPGCSSLNGLIEELGPFHVSDNGSTVYENRWAWNKVGHVLFLESPAGVGFSYATDGNTTTNGDQTASDNHAALVDFFTTKFPELKSQPFYITGESYAGVYVPTLAVLVANDKTNFPNFKGVAIGNGYYVTELSSQGNDETVPNFFYYHGIIRQNLFDKAVACCNGNPYKCDYDSFNGQCYDVVVEIFNVVNYIDPYNLYSVCYIDGGSRYSKRNFIRNKLMSKAQKKYLRSTIAGSGLPLCAQVNNTLNYLNRQDVRTALHIPSNLPTWQECNFDLNYTEIYVSMAPQFKTLISKGVRILVYNGDADSVCDIIANKQFIAGLGLTVENGTASKPWLYNDSVTKYSSLNVDVGGFYEKYQEGLDFVSVRGSGHFVPEDKPREALQMIYNYINNLPYSTPVPFSTESQPLINSTTYSTSVPFSTKPQPFINSTTVWNSKGRGNRTRNFHQDLMIYLILIVFCFY